MLVIEDEEPIRNLIQRALDSSYEVHLARNGEEGLALAQQVAPQMILLDLRMPGMDGLTVLARLKADPATAEIPVAIVSVHGETDILLEGEVAGAGDYLIKPFTIEALRRIVQRNIVPEAAERQDTDIQLPESVESVAVRKRILLIDDEEAIRRLMQRTLSDQYDVVAAKGGLEGVRLANEAHPDLIFLDLRMPGVDGLTVLARLRASPETQAIPVVIVSVHGETDVLLEGQRAGASDHIIKPFHIEELRRMARKHLG